MPTPHLGSIVDLMGIPSAARFHSFLLPRTLVAFSIFHLEPGERAQKPQHNAPKYRIQLAFWAMPQAVAAQEHERGGQEARRLGVGKAAASRGSQTILMMHIVKNFHWPRPLPFGMRMAQGLALLPLALRVYDGDSIGDPAPNTPPSH